MYVKPGLGYIHIFYALYIIYVDAVYGDKKQPLKGMEFI